jgi:1-aminocyclopropane-1-carboxylate deaminase
VAEQEAELGVFFDTIVVCSVTGSTQAGMIAGFALQDTERKVLGIDGSATVDQTWNQIASAANSATTRSSCSTSGTPAPTGSRTRRRSRPSACALGSRGVTDPVYEGESMAALIDLVHSGRIPPGSLVLYAHLVVSWR